MNAYASPTASPTEDLNRQMEELMQTLGAELRHAVAYVDSVVIPELRRESGGALRGAAVHLERWADKLDPEGKRVL